MGLWTFLSYKGFFKWNRLGKLHWSLTNTTVCTLFFIDNPTVFRSAMAGRGQDGSVSTKLSRPRFLTTIGMEPMTPHSIRFSSIKLFYVMLACFSWRSVLPIFLSIYYVCLVSIKGVNRTVIVKSPLWEQRNMFGSRIKIIREEQLFDPLAEKCMNNL